MCGLELAVYRHGYVQKAVKVHSTKERQTMRRHSFSFFRALHVWHEGCEVASWKKKLA